eukprot:365643-Chlamydomonas_euryale.AAC.16
MPVLGRTRGCRGGCGGCGGGCSAERLRPALQPNAARRSTPLRTASVVASAVPQGAVFKGPESCVDHAPRAAAGGRDCGASHSTVPRSSERRSEWCSSSSSSSIDSSGSSDSSSKDGGTCSGMLAMNRATIDVRHAPSLFDTLPADFGRACAYAAAVAMLLGSCVAWPGQAHAHIPIATTAPTRKPYMDQPAFPMSQEEALREMGARSECREALREMGARSECREALREMGARSLCREALREMGARSAEGDGRTE